MKKLKANSYNYFENILTVEELKEILISSSEGNANRKMHITKDKAYYGSLGTAMFVLEGSPVKAIAVFQRTSNEDQGFLYILPKKRYQVLITDLDKYTSGAII